MIQALRRVAAHPLLTQSQFEDFEPSMIQNLQEIYEKDSEKDYRARIRQSQSETNLTTATCTGRLFGLMPSLKPYLSALKPASDRVEQSKATCAGCNSFAAEHHVKPCEHAFCTACVDIIEGCAKGSGPACILCNVSIDRFLSGSGDDFFNKEPLSIATFSERRRPITPKQCRVATEDWLKLSSIPMPSSKTLKVKVLILE